MFTLRDKGFSLKLENGYTVDVQHSYGCPEPGKLLEFSHADVIILRGDEAVSVDIFKRLFDRQYEGDYILRNLGPDELATLLYKLKWLKGEQS